SSWALSSLKGRDWSCFRNMVSITALSAVGAAFWAGAVVGAVCAVTPELKVRAPASAAIAIDNPAVRAIAVSLFDLVAACFERRSSQALVTAVNRKSVKPRSMAITVFLRGLVKSFTCARRHRR